jgi:hypothetical protein
MAGRRGCGLWRRKKQPSSAPSWLPRQTRAGQPRAQRRRAGLDPRGACGCAGAARLWPWGCRQQAQRRTAAARYVAPLLVEQAGTLREDVCPAHMVCVSLRRQVILRKLSSPPGRSSRAARLAARLCGSSARPAAWARKGRRCGRCTASSSINVSSNRKSSSSSKRAGSGCISDCRQQRERRHQRLAVLRRRRRHS